MHSREEVYHGGVPGLLALLAHPDDEFFCGGLLAAAGARGVPLHLVYWTRGEGGGSPRFRAFWSRLPGAWHPRAREARRVAALLRASSVTFLGAVDPAPDRGLRAPDEDEAASVAKLAPLLATHSPEMVVTHGSDGDYGHPAHRKLHRIAQQLAASPAGPALVTFNAVSPDHAPTRFVNVGDPADFILDAGPYDEQRRNIVAAHRSQKGVLETLSGAGPSLDALLAATRFEGYRCWGARAPALEKLRAWTSGPLSRLPV